MKIDIQPADIRNANEALSCFAAADQWKSVLDAAGVDTRVEADRIEANRRIATGVLQAVEKLRGDSTL